MHPDGMDACKVILVVIIGTVLAGAWFFYKNQDEKVREYKEELEGLKAQNDTLLWKNKQLDKSNEGLMVKQDSLKKLLTGQAQKMNELKQMKYEKIKAIEHYTNDELFLFFSRINPDSTRAER
jgi:hypothetical protein